MRYSMFSASAAGCSLRAGASIREERRGELLLAIVKSLRLTNKISSADLVRTYLPQFVLDDNYVAMLDRMHKKAALEEDLTRRHIPFVPLDST